MDSPIDIKGLSLNVRGLTLNILAGHMCPDKYSLTYGEPQVHSLGPGN